MMTLTLTLWAALSACDVNEGTAEVVDAIGQGEPPEVIADEMRDVVERRSDLQKRLDAIGTDIETRMDQLGDDTPEEAREALESLKQDVQRLTGDLQRAGEDVGAELDEAVSDLEARIEALGDDG